MEAKIQDNVTCACGCGEFPNKGKKYVHGHNGRVANPWFNKNRIPWNKGLTKETSPTVMLISEKNTGVHPSPETIEKLRIRSIGNKYALGHTVSPETREVLRILALGNHNLGKGVAHPLWKGDAGGADTKHYRIRTKLGRPNHCEVCGKSNIGFPNYKFHWANLNHQYRDVNEEWAQLCNKCHHAYDGGKISVRELTIIQRTGDFIRMGRFAKYEKTNGVWRKREECRIK